MPPFTMAATAPVYLQGRDRQAVTVGNRHGVDFAPGRGHQGLADLAQLDTRLAAAGQGASGRPSGAGVPASMAMCTVPMLLEYMKISGIDSQRFLGLKSRMVKREIRIGLRVS